MESRRSLLAGLLAIGIAPAIVRAGSLMPIRPDYSWRWHQFYPAMDKGWLGQFVYSGDKHGYRNGPAYIVPRGFSGDFTKLPTVPEKWLLTTSVDPAYIPPMNTMHTISRAIEQRQEQPAGGDVCVVRKM